MKSVAVTGGGIADDVRLGPGVIIPQPDLVNLYGCSIGAATKVGAFVEIQRDAVVGSRCKVSSHTFICSGVTIEDEVFVGHGVMFINDTYPRATNGDARLQTERDWNLAKTLVRHGASIGSNATILGGITIGRARDRRHAEKESASPLAGEGRGGG